MTTDIRDGVVWRPEWIRYAEYGDRIALLIDRTKWACPPIPAWRPERYVTGIPAAWFGCEKCGSDHPSGEAFYTDSLAGAIAAFAEAERKLLEEP